MRIYRGLKESFKAEKQPQGLSGADFTDCPWTALSYARGSKGIVLVMDLPETGGPWVSEELWFNQDARRLMVWGRSEKWITAIIAAKHLRAYIKRSRMSTWPDRSKGRVLTQHIEELLDAHHWGRRPDPDDVLIHVRGTIDGNARIAEGRSSPAFG